MKLLQHFKIHISACHWISNNDGSSKHYNYYYDNLNRLKKSTYGDNGWIGSPAFNTEYTYDLNTNITSLKRGGLIDYVEETPYICDFTTIDNLTYEYKGNQVTRITDSGTDPTYYDAQHFVDGADKAVEYTYDANGNLTSDLNKEITRIAYNQIGLPCTVEFSNGHRTDYLYDASGRKLRTKYLLANYIAIEGPVTGEIGIELGTNSAIQSSPATPNNDSGWEFVGPEIETPMASRYRTVSARDYCGDYIYLNDTLQRINTPVGYMISNAVYEETYPQDYYDNFVHYAYIKDYQGNIRSVINESDEVIEINQYYPYGGILYDGYTTYPEKSTAQPYKYSGKELDTDNGLNLYDFHARQYDPYAPRFYTQDRASEKYPWLSPYVYCAGNPIRYIDPTGKWHIEVSASSNRAKNPYAVLNVYSKGGDVVFRTVVKVKGLNQDPRNYENADTPQGKYKILGWLPTGTARHSKEAFGKNDLLELQYLGGEGGDNRFGIHLHGGRDQTTKLSNTRGCIRIHDDDIKALKEITDGLTASDPTDIPEFLEVKDDLEIPVNYQDRERLLIQGSVILDEVEIISEKSKKSVVSTLSNPIQEPQLPKISIR